MNGMRMPVQPATARGPVRARLPVAGAVAVMTVVGLCAVLGADNTRPVRPAQSNVLATGGSATPVDYANDSSWTADRADRSQSRPAPALPQAASSITIAAVGDMNPAGNTSTSSASGRNARAIAAGLADGTLTAFLGLGDFQYSAGTCGALVNQWGKLWNSVLAKTYHIAGPTHDTRSRTDELGYRKFFNGQCPGSTVKSAAVRAAGSSIGPFEAYSFNLSSWHFAMMPTAALRYNTQSADSLAKWLDADLSAAEKAGKHLAVAYHDPYFTSATSTHRRETKVKPWIDVMDKHRVRLTLSGSQHNYERTCPVRADDTCTSDAGRGTTAFQVSTGGIGLRQFTGSSRYVVKRFSNSHGWLALTLNSDGSFAWKFNRVDGTGSDSGSRVRYGG